MKKKYLVTHANCMDGIGCAVVAKHYEIEHGIEAITVIFMNYTDGLEKLSVIEPGDDVIMADFSLPRNVLVELHAMLDGNLKVLDHHATAEDNLKGLDFCHFDMDKCGAVLLWEHLFPGMYMPILLAYIQDRDLWNWKLPNSKAVSSALKMLDKTSIHEFMPYLNDVSELIDKGNIIVAYENSTIYKIVRNKHRLSRITLGEHSVICINTTTLISEIGNALVNDEPFVAMYFIKDNEAIFSLRAEGKVDVSEIAKSYGGGGHPNAAGFSIDLNNLYFMLNS